MAPDSKTVLQSTIRTEPHAFLLPVEEVERQLKTNIESGLTNVKVQELQRDHPPNELQGGGGISGWKIFIKQISNAMILVCSISAPYKSTV